MVIATANWSRCARCMAEAREGRRPRMSMRRRGTVPDVWYVLLTVVLFGLLALAVRAVDRL
jgi:hypothetical protein